MARIIIGLLIIAIGISALFDVSLFRFIFPAILIFIGIRIMTGWGRTWGESMEKKEESGENYINEVCIFSPVNKRIKSEDFRGGKIVMIFAGGEIDISQAQSKEKEIALEVVAIFGGAKLIVPAAWQVNSEGTAIFGGFSNKTRAGQGATVLRVKGAAIFAGVEIVNG